MATAMTERLSPSRVFLSLFLRTWCKTSSLLFSFFRLCLASAPSTSPSFTSQCPSSPRPASHLYVKFEQPPGPPSMILSQYFVSSQFLPTANHEGILTPDLSERLTSNNNAVVVYIQPGPIRAPIPTNRPLVGWADESVDRFMADATYFSCDVGRSRDSGRTEPDGVVALRLESMYKEEVKVGQLEEEV